MMHDKPTWEAAMTALVTLFGSLVLARVKAVLAVPFPYLMGEVDGRRELGFDTELAPIDEVK
jgi:hypothetical protein